MVCEQIQQSDLEQSYFLCGDAPNFIKGRRLNFSCTSDADDCQDLTVTGIMFLLNRGQKNVTR